MNGCIRLFAALGKGNSMMHKRIAIAIAGTVTQTSKMPCKSYSLPTIACRTGYKLAQVHGTICSSCYADKGFYRLFADQVEPAQMARLSSIDDPQWSDAMVAHIGPDQYFRWHDSGDLQSIEHLRAIVRVCDATPNCHHWLPTREYGIVSRFVRESGTIPSNLVIRLSAMFPDMPVKIPAGLAGIPGIEVSNVHSEKPAQGFECDAYKNDGKCCDCRHCFHRSGPVSYPLH
jgi:hypothetical protein